MMPTMKAVVYVAPISVGGLVRIEVALFLARLVEWRHTQDFVSQVLVGPQVNVVPAPCARNRAVRDARQAGADYLLMVDDDMAPEFAFFPAALAFLREHPGPAVVGAPYTSGSPKEDVMCFEWRSPESGTPAVRWKIERIAREDAARRTGIQRVDNIGTGCVLYDLLAFEKVKPPFYNYRLDAEGTVAVESEDCHLHRRLATAGVPIFADWDHWAGHWKPKCCGRPVPLRQEQIDSEYRDQAALELVQAGWQPPKRLQHPDVMRRAEVGRNGAASGTAAVVSN